MQSDKRFLIEKLIICAKTTTDEDLREELISRALNLLNEADETQAGNWLERIFQKGDGRRQQSIPRREVYEHYLFCRAIVPDLPIVGKHELFRILRAYGVREWQSYGNMMMSVMKRMPSNEEEV